MLKLQNMAETHFLLNMAAHIGISIYIYRIYILQNKPTPI